MSTIDRGPGSLFITFEGPDGSGKTTQMHLLAERLRKMGREVVETVEPGGTRIGKDIRGILLDSKNRELSPTAELLLYFSSRAQNVDELINPALARGAIVLSDRFTDSTLAYQGAGRRLGRDVVMTIHQIACRGLNPDLTIVVDIDPETGLERAHARNRTIRDKDERRLDEEEIGFHQRVRKEYLDMAQREPGRIKVIDGCASIETVAERVWNTVRPYV